MWLNFEVLNGLFAWVHASVKPSFSLCGLKQFMDEFERVVVSGSCGLELYRYPSRRCDFSSGLLQLQYNMGPCASRFILHCISIWSTCFFIRIPRVCVRRS